MKKFRILLLPFSWIYGSILWLRNMAYNYGLFHSLRPEIKTITIGNIALGGTGKTPHIEYLLTVLFSKKVAVLSRGYGRTTSGTLEVKPDMSASETGDEPLQMARKFPKIPVIVDEKRKRGLAFIQKNYPDIDLVLLDDALQHRSIEAGMNVLLTTFDQPFYKDSYLPAGNLRDHKVRARNADIILVTKCPENMGNEERKEIESYFSKYAAAIYFDRIVYKSIKSLFSSETREFTTFKKVLLITGIAKSEYFVKAAESKFTIAAHFTYPDHHRFDEADLTRFRKFIGSFALGEIAVLTTEKDAMRLEEIIHRQNRPMIPVFYWEIGIDLGVDKRKFDNLISAYAN